MQTNSWARKKEEDKKKRKEGKWKEKKKWKKKEEKKNFCYKDISVFFGGWGLLTRKVTNESI